jgi:hypothetical protein
MLTPQNRHIGRHIALAVTFRLGRFSLSLDSMVVENQDNLRTPWRFIRLSPSHQHGRYPAQVASDQFTDPDNERESR